MEMAMKMDMKTSTMIKMKMEMKMGMEMKMEMKMRVKRKMVTMQCLMLCFGDRRTHRGASRALRRPTRPRGLTRRGRAAPHAPRATSCRSPRQRGGQARATGCRSPRHRLQVSPPQAAGLPRQRGGQAARRSGVRRLARPQLQASRAAPGANREWCQLAPTPGGRREECQLAPSPWRPPRGSQVAPRPLSKQLTQRNHRGLSTTMA